MKGDDAGDKISEYKELIERSKKGIELAKKLIEEDKTKKAVPIAKEEKRELPIPREIPKIIEVERRPLEVKEEVPFIKPILDHVKKDYLTTVLVMRWIEFLFERVKRDKITLVLDYYKEIGWITEEVKTQVMAYARG